MSDTTPSDSNRTPEQPTDERGSELGGAPGSAPSSDPVAIAVAGYMADRADLISQIPEVNLYYERDQAKRDWMVQEIERIDRIVDALLAPLIHGQAHVPNT